MTKQIKWKTPGFYFLQNDIWFPSPFQGDENAVREYLRLSAIEFTELERFEAKPDMEVSAARPVVPKLKLWKTTWSYSSETHEGIPVDKRLVIVAPNREIAAEGANGYDDEDPCNPATLGELKGFFDSKKVKSLVTTGKMPSITNTLMFCYFDPSQRKWVTPIEMVAGYV